MVYYFCLPHTLPHTVWQPVKHIHTSELPHSLCSYGKPACGIAPHYRPRLPPSSGMFKVGKVVCFILFRKVYLYAYGPISKVLEVIQYQNQTSRALSLSHHTRLVSQNKDAQKTKTKQHTEQYRVFPAPGGKAEPKMTASRLCVVTPPSTELKLRLWEHLSV